MSKKLQVVNIVVINSNGLALILRRSKTHPTLAFQSDLPGGIVDSREDMLSAVVRELNEETGIVVAQQDVQYVYDAQHHDFLHDIHRTLYFIELEMSDIAVKLSWEHDQYAWMPLEDVATIEQRRFSFYADALVELMQLYAKNKTSV